MPIAFTSDTAGTYTSGDPFTIVWTVEALTHAPPLPAAECLRQMLVGRYNAVFGFSGPAGPGLSGPGSAADPFANGIDPRARRRLIDLEGALFNPSTPLCARFARTSTLPALPAPDGSGLYWLDHTTVEMYTVATLLEDAGYTAIDPRIPSAPWAVQLYTCLALLQYHWADYDESTGLYGLAAYTAEP